MEKTMGKFADWFIEHDKFIMEARLKQEKHTLKKELRLLEDESNRMRSYLDRVDALIEKDEKSKSAFTDKSDMGGPQMWSQLESRLADWEKRLVKLWSKKPRDYIDIDREYIARELPLLNTEKNAIETRLRKIEELIAKTRLLIDDLNEDLCRELSGGHSLAAVGEAIVEEFGRRLMSAYSEGRKKFRDFLEAHYRINKAASRDLLSLLEEAGMLRYRFDLSDKDKGTPLVYYAPGEFSYVADPGVIYHLEGWWEIIA